VPHCQRIARCRHIVVRAGWKNARWQQQNGEAFDLLDAFRNAADRRIDQLIWIARKHGPALALHLIAIRKSDAAAAESQRKARRQTQTDGYARRPGQALAVLDTDDHPAAVDVDDLEVHHLGHTQAGGILSDQRGPVFGFATASRNRITSSAPNTTGSLRGSGA
jgi:hypothetical protein